MRKIILLITLIFSLTMFSSTSFAEWTKVGDSSGNTIYVDVERIRKVDGYVYWWDLIDFLKPNKGYLSAKTYSQGDCELFQVKYLSSSLHKEPMGGGPGDSESRENPKWYYPPPDSLVEFILKRVCAYANQQD